MVRKTLTVLSLIGLLLSVGLWGASMWDPMCESHDGKQCIALHNGRLYIHVVRRTVWGLDYKHSGSGSGLPSMKFDDTLRPQGIPDTRDSILPSYDPPGFSLNGHKIDGQRLVTSITRNGGFVLPLYLPLVVFSIVPGIWVWRSTRRLERRGRGKCENCGYDLRGSKERCPECGEAIG